MSTTNIQWTDRVWNPVRGCSVVSAGCHNCYAMKQAHRFSGLGMPYENLTKQTSRMGAQWTGDVKTLPWLLIEPLKWTKPQRVFVNSMSDLFHDAVPDAFIDCVFNVMAYCPHLTFQVLTKRPERMRRYLGATDRMVAVGDALVDNGLPEQFKEAENARICRGMDKVTKNGNIVMTWPLPNVWLGVSVEDQETADERIPALLQTPAAVKFVSYEPALGPVDLSIFLATGWDTPPHDDILNWVIVGGESGPGARPLDVAWAYRVVDQCVAAGVPVFVKQLGAVPMLSEAEWRASERTALLNHRNHKRVPADFVPVKLKDRKGGDPAEWPEDLRVREFPR